MPKKLTDTVDDIKNKLYDAQPLVKYGTILADIGQKSMDVYEKAKKKVKNAIPNPPSKYKANLSSALTVTRKRGDIDLPAMRKKK